MKKSRSPQEMKLLSYEKDPRNTYGERGSHSRHAIAAHKTRDHRVYRRQTNQILSGEEINQAELVEEIDVEVKSIHESSWHKCPDEPLGKVVEGKLARRKDKGINATVKKTLLSND